MNGRLTTSLLIMRIAVFAVMCIWTIDKFMNPGHAIEIFGHFYMLQGEWFTSNIMYIIGGIEMVVLVAFLLGIMKTISYGLVMIFHAISTISTYKYMTTPFMEPNMLFFTAIPMLAACIALFLLREDDTKWSIG